MKIFLIIIMFIFCGTALAQHKFEVKNASKYFDIKISVEKCDESSCMGNASFSFLKKGSSKAYQVIEMEDTYISLGEGGKPEVNKTMLYDEQSVINVDDFNFDGMEDIAICDGQNGSYGMPSYEVYLSSKATRKFVYSKEFSELGAHLGMFEVKSKQRRLSTFDKSGCCWHITEEYIVKNNRPVKVFEEVEDATHADGALADKVKITTKKLIGGKWKTTVKYVKRQE